MGSDFEHQSMLAMPFALEVARCLVRMSKRQPPRGRNATMGFSLLNLDSQLHNAMQCRGHREKLLQRILISFYEKRKFWGWQAKRAGQSWSLGEMAEPGDARQCRPAVQPFRPTACVMGVSVN